ncbi:hypothetical protein DRO37_03360 [Candidatus Bathyarchaeota archaeon]|nr:MAG: hypothetical protein DRO37_03360 [Candidatus Bathyarchaeota archaeon]
MLIEEAERLGLRIDGTVRFDRQLYISCLRREPLKSDLAIIDLKKILKIKLWQSNALSVFYSIPTFDCLIRVKDYLGLFNL